MARPAPFLAFRTSPAGARPLTGPELRAASVFAQTVLVSLAVVFGASWQEAPLPPERLLFTVADPALAAAPVPAAEAASVAATASWAARAPAPVRATATIRLSDALRAIVPGAGKTMLIDPETLWLARCMYSESDLPHEQELVAWVVRNRVATAYRGQRTYRDVVLDDRQFSAFNLDGRRRDYYLALQPHTSARGWRRTLAIAAYVRRAPWTVRPFGVEVRHFYSEVSMVGRRAPTWAHGQSPVAPNRLYRVDPARFRFFALPEGRG